MVHPAAARGFSRSSALYERARPGYPPAAVAWLAECLGIGPGAAVLDLAAGTGRLTRLLATTGADVVAVEPVAEMRAAIGSGALAGTAEAIPVADGRVDAVTVGEAFHWFDGLRALAEIHRVLRPGGRLGLAISFVASLDAQRRESVLSRARALAGGGEVELRFRCEVQVASRLA